jgi:thioredoxin-like negative regulator of GroEL
MSSPINSNPIISAMTLAEFQQMQMKAKNTIIVVKFGAEWCKPCKLIKSTCEEWSTTRRANIIYADIDIDESMDLYMAFKSKKMVRGVPVILAFNTALPRDQWYIPDRSVEGGDIEAVKLFLSRL